jgi:hypothetical protein
LGLGDFFAPTDAPEATSLVSMPEPQVFDSVQTWDQIQVLVDDANATTPAVSVPEIYGLAKEIHAGSAVSSDVAR